MNRTKRYKIRFGGAHCENNRAARQAPHLGAAVIRGMGKIRKGNTPVPVRLGRIQHNVPQAFTAVAHLIMAENEDGRPVAFMGKGLGTCLMQYGIEHYKIQELTVNEQNPQAKCFWLPSLQKSGYDQQGRPYPLVSMRRP